MLFPLRTNLRLTSDHKRPLFAPALANFCSSMLCKCARIFVRTLLVSFPTLPLVVTCCKPCQDLASVQKLLLQKTSEREEEDVLLLDAAQVVAQRRKGRGGAGVEKEGVGARATDSLGEGAGKERGGGGTAASSANRQTRVRKFENTGWFHTYE